MDRYERIKTLGRGAFGVAVLVREKAAMPASSPGPLRVIKDVDLGQLPVSARKEAQKEVIVLARFKHPNIVEYFTAFIDVDKQSLHIVMEYADGGDLAAIIRQRREEQCRFAECDALVILAQCLEALVHIHSKHVLHRDIKGQNIFCTKGGTVKLGDFGIARVMEHTASAAKTMIGTPNYLAPEVCENAPYNDRADIWSLGVVFYELLTLQQPFQAYNMAALVLKIVTAEPAPLPPDLGPEVVDIAQRTLQKKPEGRPGAAELLNLPAVRRLVGSRFQLTQSNGSRSALKTPSVLHAGGSSHFQLSGGNERDVLKVEHAYSPEQFQTASEARDEDEEFHTAIDAVDELRQQIEAQPAETSIAHQELLSLQEQTRLNKELLSPQEQARLNKARVEGNLFGHVPWHVGGDGDRDIGHTQTRQAVREAPSPWDWQAVSAQAEQERKRNRERLTRNNWHGPGLGFLGGGVCYEHTPMGSAGTANRWHEEEHGESHGTTRPQAGAERDRGATQRSGSASSLGVAGSVVARSRPAALGGSGGSDAAQNNAHASPGRPVRLTMSNNDTPDSTRSSSIRGSPRPASRPTTGSEATERDCLPVRFRGGSGLGGPGGPGGHGSAGRAARRPPSSSSSAARPTETPAEAMRLSTSPGPGSSRLPASHVPSAGERQPSPAAVRGRPSGAQPTRRPSGTTGVSTGVGRGTHGAQDRRSGSRPRQPSGVGPRGAEAAPPAVRDGSTCGTVAMSTAGATETPLPAAPAPAPAPAALAERFAWASRFADAPLDMQLPAYADSRGERERLGELDSLFSEIARLTNDKGDAAEEAEEHTLIPAGGGTAGTLEAGMGFFAPGDVTEDWSGAEMFNDENTFTSNVTEVQADAASREDILAAALKA